MLPSYFKNFIIFPSLSLITSFYGLVVFLWIIYYKKWKRNYPFDLHDSVTTGRFKPDVKIHIFRIYLSYLNNKKLTQRVNSTKFTFEFKYTLIYALIYNYIKYFKIRTSAICLKPNLQNSLRLFLRKLFINTNKNS